MKLVSKKQLAAALNVSERTVDRWRQRGNDLGEIKTPGLPRFDVERVETAIRSGTILKKRRK